MSNSTPNEVVIGKCDVEIVGLCSQQWYECKLLLKENVLTYQRSCDHVNGKPINLQNCLLCCLLREKNNVENGFLFEIYSKDMKQKWLFRTRQEQTRTTIMHKLSKHVIGTKLSEMDTIEKILFTRNLPEGFDKLRAVLNNAIEVIPFR